MKTRVSMLRVEIELLAIAGLLIVSALLASWAEAVDGLRIGP